MALLELSDLAEHLNWTKLPTDDKKLAEVQRMLDAGIQRVEDACGPLEAREVTERVEVVRGIGLVSTWPVLALISARTAPRPWQPTSTPGTALVAGVDQAGLLYTERTLTATVLATLSVGRNPVPDGLALAALIIAAQLYESQRVAGNATGPGEAVLAGFAVPRRAMELMAPHMAPRIT